MDNEKLQINLAPGMSKAELVIREGAAAKELEPKAPVKTNLKGVIGAVVEYLKKRINTGQFEQKDCLVLVNRESIEITLITNEADEYRRGEITGKLSYNPKFIEFGINGGEYITNFEMAELFKMNRAYFENRSVAMKLVTDLQNFKAKVDKEIENSDNKRGDRRILINQAVQSNLPEAFNLVIPVFKGCEKQTVQVEVYVNPNDFTCTLVSAQSNELIIETRDTIIDEVLERIRLTCPDIVIIEQKASNGSGRGK